MCIRVPLAKKRLWQINEFCAGFIKTHLFYRVVPIRTIDIAKFDLFYIKTRETKSIAFKGLDPLDQSILL